jgi:ribonucleotide monophosphatase NagD (HAD superfamily)
MLSIGLRMLDCAPQEAAIVGDRLDTDVIGGRRAGLRTILVLTGVTNPSEANAAATRPDAVVGDLASVAGLLGWR